MGGRGFEEGEARYAATAISFSSGFFAFAWFAVKKQAR
jgi:hypothetical protein